MSRTSRCMRCGDVIGMYEPMVVVGHAGVRHTSRAAEAPHPPAGEARYHGACYEPVRVAEQETPRGERRAASA